MPNLKPQLPNLFGSRSGPLSGPIRRPRRLGSALLALAGLAAAGPLSGCASTALTPAQVASTANPLTLTADWDDLDAGVEVGLSQAEAVQVGQPAVSPDGRERVYRFEHITGLKGTLTATRLSERPGAATVRLACQAGTIRQADLERRVLARVGLRLGDLLGREFAPIRE